MAPSLLANFLATVHCILYRTYTGGEARPMINYKTQCSQKFPVGQKKWSHNLGQCWGDLPYMSFCPTFVNPLLDDRAKTEKLRQDLIKFQSKYRIGTMNSLLLINFRIKYTGESNNLLGWHRPLDPTSHCTNSGSDLLESTVCVHFALHLYRGAKPPLSD